MLNDIRWRGRAWVLLASVFAAGALGIHMAKRGSSLPPIPPPAAKPWQALDVCYTNHAWAVPLFVAVERRLFAHQGIEVKLKSLGYPIHIRLGGVPAPSEGGLQIAWGGESPGFADFEDIEVLEGDGLDFTQRPGAVSRLLFVHPVGITPAGDMITALLVRNAAGIKAWEDFKGKKIGIYEPGDGRVLQRVLRAHGLNAFSSEANDIPPSPIWRGAYHFDSGQLDALYTWGSIARKLMAERPGAYRVFAQNLDCEPGGQPSYAVCTYINSETLAGKPEAIRRYVAAIDEAIDFIRAFPDAARAMMPEYSSLDRSAAKRMEIYHFLKSTEQVDFDALSRELASRPWPGKKENASITPEIYYPHWAAQRE